MSKNFWFIIIAIAVVLGVIFKLTDSSKNTSNTTTAKPTQHIEGQGKDGITLVEYGDYECPYCEEYYPIVKQVASTYSQQIFFQFRNLPLTQIHPNAFAGARAAEAASLQGDFWQMHDALYNNQSQWVPTSDPEQDFINYAKQLGLNTSEFQTDYSSSQVNNTINADVSAFNKTGLQEATPTFILDGKQIQPGPSLSSFQQFVNAEITKKTGGSSSAPAPANSTSPNQSVQTNTTSNTTK